MLDPNGTMPEKIRNLIDGDIIVSMIKAVIFDADGPLYHRTAEVDKEKQLLLANYGFSDKLHKFTDAYEEEKFKGYDRSETVAEMFQNILRALGIHTTLETAERFAEQFEIIQREVTATPNAASTLKQLKSEGYKMCVLTDSFYSAADKWPWFKEMGLDSYLDGIISSYDIQKLKDTPEAYQACLNSLDVGADEAIFVGHQEYEMIGAKAAHIPSVAVIPIAPPNIHADYKIANLSELPQLLTQINSAK